MNLVPQTRGCRECRVLAAPAVSCARDDIEAHTSIQVQPEHSGIPCAMALRLMPSSPWRRIRLASITAGLMAQSIRLDQMRHRQLGTSHGCRDHTVLPYAATSIILRAVLHSRPKPPCERLLAPDAAASAASHPNVRDDGQRPSSSGRDGGFVGLIWVGGEADYFCNRDWTGQIRLKLLGKIVPSRMPE